MNNVRKRGKAPRASIDRKDSTSSRGSVETEQPSARATRSSARLKKKTEDNAGTAAHEDATPKAQPKTKRTSAQRGPQKKEELEKSESSDVGSVGTTSSPDNMLADAHALVDFASTASSQSKKGAAKSRKSAGKESSATANSNESPNQPSSSININTRGLRKSRDEDEDDKQPNAVESDGSGDSVELSDFPEKPPADKHEEPSVAEGGETVDQNPSIRSHLSPSPVTEATEATTFNNNEHPNVTKEKSVTINEEVSQDSDRPPELSPVKGFTNDEDDQMDVEPPQIVREEPEQKPLRRALVEEPPEEPSDPTDHSESTVRERLTQWPPESWCSDEEESVRHCVSRVKEEEMEVEEPVSKVVVKEEPQAKAPVDMSKFNTFSMKMHPHPISDIPPPPPPAHVAPPPPPVEKERPAVVVKVEKDQPPAALIVKVEPQDSTNLTAVAPKPIPTIQDPRLMQELQRLTQQIAFEKQLKHTPVVVQPAQNVDPAERWKEMAALWQKSAEESRIQLEQAQVATMRMKADREAELRLKQQEQIDAARSKAVALLQSYAKEHQKVVENKADEGPSHGAAKDAGEKEKSTPEKPYVSHVKKVETSGDKAVAAKQTEHSSHRRSRSRSPATRRDKHHRSRSREKKRNSHSRDRNRSRSRSHERHRHSRSRSPRRRNHSDHRQGHHHRQQGKKDSYIRHQKNHNKRRHSRSPDRSVDRKSHHERKDSKSYSRSPPRHDSPVAPMQDHPKETQPMPERMEEIPLPPPTVEEAPAMPTYQEIETLIFLDEKVMKNGKKTKRTKERSIQCDCKQNGLDCSDNRCMNRQMLCECGSKCPLGDTCKNRRFARREYADVLPFYTGPQKGWGVKARSLIPKDTFIIEYIGEVVTAEQFLARTKIYAKDPKHKHHYIFELGAKLIDATVKGNCSRFINHSCAPNAVCLKWSVPRTPSDISRIGFFAIRDILPGDEVTFDYQFLNYGKKAQQCFCGAPTCKGIIGEEVADDGDSDDELEDEVEETENDDDEKTEEERIQQEFEKEEEREYLAQKRITSIISSAIPRSKMAKKAQVMVRDLMHVDESNFKLRVLTFLQHSDAFYQFLKRSNLYDVFASWLSPVDWSRHDMELKLGVFRLISNHDTIDKTTGWTVSCCQAVENLANMEMPDVLAVRGAIDTLLDRIAGPVEADIDPDADPDQLADLTNEQLFFKLRREAKQICHTDFEDVKRSCAVTKFKIPKKVKVERAEAGKDPGSTHEYTVELRKARSRKSQKQQGFFGRGNSNNNYRGGYRPYNNHYNDRPRFYGGERNLAPVRYFNEPSYFNDHKYGKRKFGYENRDRRNDHPYDNYHHHHEEPGPDSRGSVDAKRPRMNRFDIPARSPVREQPPQPMLLDPMSGRHFEPLPVHEPVDMEIDRDTPPTPATMELETPQRDVPTPMTMASTDPRTSSATPMNLVTPPKPQATPAMPDYSTYWHPSVLSTVSAAASGSRQPAVAVVAPNARQPTPEQRIQYYVDLPEEMFKMIREHLEQEVGFIALADERRTSKAAAAAKAKADQVRNKRTVNGAVPVPLQPPPPPKRKSLWARAYDQDGATYYYHRETSETTWDLPEGEVCDDTEAVTYHQEAEPDSSSNVEEARPDLGTRLMDLLMPSHPSTVAHPSTGHDTQVRPESRTEHHRHHHHQNAPTAARNENRLKEYKTTVENVVRPMIFRYLQAFPSSLERKEWMVKRVAKEMSKRESQRDGFDYQIHTAGRNRMLSYTQKFMERKIEDNGKDLWKGYE